MFSFRPFLVLLVALATLLLSFQAPVNPTVRQAKLTDSWFQYAIEKPAEENKGSEEGKNSGQKGPLEEIHDLHCSVDRQKLIFWRQDNASCKVLHPPLWTRIPLMCCFQPPEQG